jgi:hypothetical protein
MLRIKVPARRIPIVIVVVVAILVPIVTYATLQRVSSNDAQPSEIELITLRPSGFEPAEVTRPKGAFVLFIDDRSGREESSLVLQRLNGGQLRAIGLQRKRSEWNDVVDLTPGTYVLQDANNSELRCQITILP